MVRVRVLAFGVLKDALRGGVAQMELPDGATVADLLVEVARRNPAVHLDGIAVGVNSEFARAAHRLHDGDEVGLLPPVSGGATPPLGSGRVDSSKSPVVIALTRDVIDAGRLIADAKSGKDGAVVVLDGIVRDNSRGRQTLYLDYEAYEEMALRQMRELAEGARTRFGVRHITIVHRLGRLQIGETSVLIIVSSAHRAQAYEASRLLIDTLKRTVPIWKKETFVDGAVWVDGEPFPDQLGLEATDAS